MPRRQPSPQSYWQASTPPFTGGAEGPLEGRTDVAIVGGGFTGLSAAIALAKRGASVAVLEAGEVGGEASGRNGGQCNAGTAHDYGALVASLGMERAAAYYRAHVDAVDTVERLTIEEAIDCDFSRCGRLKLAAKPAHYDKFARSAEQLAEIDPDVALIPPERLRDEVACPEFHGGLLQRTSAQLHPGKLVRGLAIAAVRHGARIFEHAPVAGLERQARGWLVETPRGRLEAGQVLLATGGAPIAGPFGWFKRRIVTVGSFVIATEPLSEALVARLLPARRNYVTSKAIGNYFRLALDNRLIFGGRARFAVSSDTSDIKGGRILEATMRGLFPALHATKIEHVWGGNVDLTADRLPRAGEHEGLFYAMGYSGHGVQMSVHMGQRMAEVMDGRPEANPWRDLDWPSVPGHFGKPWFLPMVGLYYRLQDMLH
jgi:glycine/D-amino acid oxidase-like deaminating enzyme